MNEKVILYLILHVDHILIEISSNIEIDKLNEILNGEFDMEYLGESKRIMCIDIIRSHKKS